MTLHTVHVLGVPLQPWRNGGGVARDLLYWPTSGAQADWHVRVSVARIDRDGPFSHYPGVQRCFSVLSGQGVQLEARLGDEAAIRRPHQRVGRLGQRCAGYHFRIGSRWPRRTGQRSGVPEQQISRRTQRRTCRHPVDGQYYATAGRIQQLKVGILTGHRVYS